MKNAKAIENGQVKPINLASSLAYGIGLADDDQLMRTLGDMELAPNRTDSRVLAEKADALVGMMQQLHVTTRDNNAILSQMLFSMEERLNARINHVRQEMINLINEKAGNMTASNTHNSQATTAAEKSRWKISAVGAEKASRRSTLSKIFEGIESLTNDQSDLAVNNQSLYESVQVTPIPGFVIKTRKLLGNKDKVFINIYHHEYIEVDPVVSNSKGEVKLDNRPYLIVGEMSNILDKNGHNCATFNVAVSSEYFRQINGLDLKITAPSSIQKIIHKLNLKFGEFLDESSYLLPRSATGFKGEIIPTFTLTVPVKSDTSLSSPPPVASAVPRPSTCGGLAQGRRGNSCESMDLTTLDNNSVISELTSELPAQRQGSLLSDRGSLEASNSQWETGSTASAASRHNSVTSSARKRPVPRKSIFDTAQLPMNEGNIAGRNLLSGDMLSYQREESVDNSTAEALKRAAGDDPSSLLGWQISMEDAQKNEEIFVVTAVRKNYLSKTEFRVSRFGAEDVWVRLRRREGKTGFDFRPMRKVLFSLSDEDDGSVA
jgi:hypothetical protein